MHSIRTRLTVLFVTLSSVVAVLITAYFISSMPSSRKTRRTSPPTASS